MQTYTPVYVYCKGKIPGNSERFPQSFPVIHESLLRDVGDRQRGTFGVYDGSIERRYDELTTPLPLSCNRRPRF